MSYRLDIHPKAMADISEAAGGMSNGSLGLASDLLGRSFPQLIVWGVIRCFTGCAITAWASGGALPSIFPIELCIGLWTRSSPSWLSYMLPAKAGIGKNDSDRRGVSLGKAEIGSVFWSARDLRSELPKSCPPRSGCHFPPALD